MGVWQRHRHSCAAHAVAAGADAGLAGRARPCDRRSGDDTVCGRAAERIVVLGAGGRIHPLGRGSCAGRTAVGIHRHYVRLVCAGQYADAHRNGVPAGRVRIRVPCRGHVPYRRPAQAAHIRSGRGHRRTVLHPCGGRRTAAAVRADRRVPDVPAVRAPQARHAVAYSGSCRLCGGPYARQCGALRRFGHVASTVRRHHSANVIRQRVAGVAEPA